MARMPSFCPDNATPCAWLPAEAVITPRSSWSLGNWLIRLYAPRNLKENTGCKSSRLKRMLLFSFSLIRGAASSGVSIATS